MKDLKIISLPVDDGGCGWYRVRQPLEMIKRFTSHDTHIIDSQKDDMVEVSKALKVADVVIVRPGAEEGMERILAMEEFKDKPWVMDIDDNFTLISPYSNHYEDYGTEDFYDANLQKWLWKNGERGFDVAKNRERLKKHFESLGKASMITTTNKLLAKIASKYNERTAVLPNCIDFERWWKLNLKPNKELRVGWAGGSSHYEDWYSIKEPLNSLMRKYKFKLVMIGHSFPGVIDEDNKYLLELQDWVPFKGHSYRMMCMALDIAIVPLADLPFNYYKSSIKWYEMSAMGVPCVVSNIAPYCEDIRDGRTALGYRTPGQFYSALEKLLLCEHTRKRIGNNAYSWVKANRDARKMANQWIKAYREVIQN